MLILMCVPLAFSLLNRFTHNLPLEAPLIYIPSLAFVGCARVLNTDLLFKSEVI